MVLQRIRSTISVVILGSIGFLGALIGCVPGLSHFIDIGSSYASSLLRIFTGKYVVSGIEQAPRPKQLLALFEHEGNTQCKKAREIISALDLSVLVYPCPRPTIVHKDLVPHSRFRDVVTKEMGSCQLPCLFDDDKGKKIAGGDQIVDYIWETYSPPGAHKPFLFSLLVPSFVNEILLLASTCVRPAFRKTGARQTPSRVPENMKPLKLWSFEACPYSRLVRETLSTLELPYILYNCGKGSKMLETQKIGTKIHIPYLEDPNNDFSSAESSSINAYLRKTYQIG